MLSSDPEDVHYCQDLWMRHSRAAAKPMARRLLREVRDTVCEGMLSEGRREALCLRGNVREKGDVYLPNY